MKQLSLFFFLFIPPILLNAQNTQLYPIEENSLYGFINAEGGKVIPPIFPAVGNFSEGLAPARKEGLYGYINEKGQCQSWTILEEKRKWNKL